MESNELPQPDNQPEEVNEATQKDLFPELSSFDPEDHIRVDSYSSAIYITESRLMEMVKQLTQLMTDVHQNTMMDIYGKYEYRKRVARSYHQQAATITKKYLPLYRQNYSDTRPVFMRDIEVALEEAAILFDHASKVADREREKRSQGNVVFSRQKLKAE